LVMLEILRCDTIILKMKYKTYKDLVSSPFAREDAEPEEILLELAVKFGSKASVLDICRALTLIHENYHTIVDRAEDLTVSLAASRQIGKSYSTIGLARSLLSQLNHISPKLVPVQKVNPVPLMTISDLPNLAYPSDTILKNLFKLLFETSELDDIATSERLKKHVEKLYSKARSTVKMHSKVKDEEWRTFPDRKSEQLLEIWAEMLDKIAEKRKTLESIQEKGKSNG